MAGQPGGQEGTWYLGESGGASPSNWRGLNGRGPSVQEYLRNEAKVLLRMYYICSWRWEPMQQARIDDRHGSQVRCQLSGGHGIAEGMGAGMMDARSKAMDGNLDQTRGASSRQRSGPVDSLRKKRSAAGRGLARAKRARAQRLELGAVEVEP